MELAEEAECEEVAQQSRRPRGTDEHLQRGAEERGAEGQQPQEPKRPRAQRLEPTKPRAGQPTEQPGRGPEAARGLQALERPPDTGGRGTAGTRAWGI